MTSSALSAMGISISQYAPFDSLPDSPQKTQMLLYLEQIQTLSMYLRAFPETLGGHGLIVYAASGSRVDPDSLVVGFLGQYCTDPKIKVPPQVRGRDVHTHGVSITKFEASSRAQVYRADTITDLSKQFDEPAKLAEFRRIHQTRPPLFLGLLDIEGAPSTDWNSRVLYNVLKSRVDIGNPTIITTRHDAVGLRNICGHKVVDLLLAKFQSSDSWRESR